MARSDTLPLTVALTQAVHTLEARMGALDDALRAEGDWFAWVLGCEERAPARAMARQVIRMLEFEKDQAPNTTVTAPGLLAISEETRELVQEVNAAKDVLRQAVKQMEGITVTEEVPTRVQKPDGEEEWRPVVRTVPLSIYHVRVTMKRPHFHFLQAWRRVPLLDLYPVPPARVGFSWTHTAKVYRITVAEARTRLERLGTDPNIRRQIYLLDQMPPEEPLALVKALPEHVRANVAWRLPGQKSPARKPYRASLPLLYVADKDAPPPIIARPRRYEFDYRPRRLDAKIEERPYLESIHVHRYLPEYRHGAEEGNSGRKY